MKNKKDSGGLSYNEQKRAYKEALKEVEDEKRREAESEARSEAFRRDHPKFSKFHDIFWSIIIIAVMLKCCSLILFNDEDKKVENVNKQITINVNDIIVREEASTSTEITGHVHYGETYEILDIIDGDKYTWYKISDNQWVPDDGTWLIIDDLNN